MVGCCLWWHVQLVQSKRDNSCCWWNRHHAHSVSSQANMPHLRYPQQRHQICFTSAVPITAYHSRLGRAARFSSVSVLRTVYGSAPEPLFTIPHHHQDILHSRHCSPRRDTSRNKGSHLFRCSARHFRHICCGQEQIFAQGRPALCSSCHCLRSRSAYI